MRFMNCRVALNIPGQAQAASRCSYVQADAPPLEPLGRCCNALKRISVVFAPALCLKHQHQGGLLVVKAVRVSGSFPELAQLTRLDLGTVQRV